MTTRSLGLAAALQDGTGTAVSTLQPARGGGSRGWTRLRGRAPGLQGSVTQPRAFLLKSGLGRQAQTWQDQVSVPQPPASISQEKVPGRVLAWRPPPRSNQTLTLPAPAAGPGV